MKEFGLKAKSANVAELGIPDATAVYWNLAPEELIQKTLERGEGVLADNGALVVDTGEFKGRAPKDKFVVWDEVTADTVWWGDVNNKFDKDKFESLYHKVTAHLSGG